MWQAKFKYLRDPRVNKNNSLFSFCNLPSRREEGHRQIITKQFDGYVDMKRVSLYTK